MRRYLILRRARRLCEEALCFYGHARRCDRESDAEGAAIFRRAADAVAWKGLDALALAEPYLPAE